MKICCLIGVLAGVAFTLVNCSEKDHRDISQGGQKETPRRAKEDYSAQDPAATRNQSAPVMGLQDKAQFIRALEDDGMEKFGQLEARARSLVLSEPVETLHLIMGMPPGTKRDTLLGSIAVVFPSAYAGEFLKAIESSGDREDYSALTAFFGRRTNLPSFQETEALLGQVTSDRSRAILLRALGTAYGLRDDLAASSGKFWNTQYSDKDNREVNNAVLGIVTESKPDTVTSVLDRNWDAYDAEARSQALYELGAGKYAGKTAPSVMAMVGAKGYEQTVDPFLGSWLNASPMTASKWISTLPTGGTKDRAVAQMVRYLEKKGDKASAEQWSKQIRDPSILEQTR